jgi:hypothetical protein
VADRCRCWQYWYLRQPTRPLMWALVVLAVAALSACRSAPPPPSAAGGTYTSAKYHFSVTYPNGWQVNTPSGSTPSATVPLEIVITQIDAQAAGGAQVSSCTIAVYNAKDKVAAAQINQLLKEAHQADSPLKTITISRKSGYQDKPVEGTVPGTQVTDTHIDYYLITSNYEYQISIDALSSDNSMPALQGMLKSFTLLS